MTVIVEAPRIEHHREALGIGEDAPRLSWRVPSAPAGWDRTPIASRSTRGDATDRTFTVDSAEQVLVPWPAPPLRSRERARVRVSVRGADGEWSAPSDPTTARGRPARARRTGSRRPVGAHLERGPPLRRAPALARAPRLRRSGSGLVRARLYATRARTLRGRAQRPTGRRRHALARLDGVRPAAALLHLRRDRPADEGAERDRRMARRRLVPRPPRLARRVPQPLRQRPVVPRSAGADLRRRHARGGRDGRLVAGRAEPDPALAASTTARTTTPARSTPAGAGRLRRLRLGARRRCATATRRPSSRRPPRPCGARRSSRRSRCSPARAAAASSTSDRTSSAGCGSGSAGEAGATVTLRTAEVLQDGELYTRPLRGARSTDTTRSPAGRTARSGSRASPSTASATSRFAAGRATSMPRRRRRPRRAGLPHRPRAHRLVRMLRPLREPPARERRVGHARQLRRHPDRLPAARRACRLDRRHPGVRPDRILPLRRARHAVRLAARPRARAAPRRHGALVRAGHPRPRHVDADPPGRRVGRCRDPPAVDAATSGSATWACCARSSTAPARGSTSSSAWPARRVSGTPASSSATGSIPPRRRRTPPTPAPTATSSRRRTSPAPRARWRAMAEVLGLAEERERYAPPRRRGRGRLRGGVRRRRRHDDQRRADRVRPRPRIRPDPRCRAPGRRRGAPRRARARGRQPHRDRLRRHAARHRRAERARPRRQPPTTCCSSGSAPRGSTRSTWARRRSGSAGTRCCPTAPSTPAR